MIASKIDNDRSSEIDDNFLRVTPSKMKFYEYLLCSCGFSLCCLVSWLSASIHNYPPFPSCKSNKWWLIRFEFK